MGSSPESLAQHLAQEMARWEESGLRRRLEAGVPGRVDFVSNDYLGLARHPEVVEAARAALAEEGAGGRASRLLGGGSSWHTRAEEAVAEWLGAEAALLFPSGYQANLGLVGALVGRGDAVFSDARNHASLIDAARLSRARLHVHAHLDLEELDRLLARARDARHRLVLTEGVFSMDGDAPDLAALADLCDRHDAWLIVDEAHSVGLVGPEGAGAWAALGRDRPGPLAARIVTGGKALGLGGAFVVGGSDLREHLVNRARSFVFTTAPPPATAAGLAVAVGLARKADVERAHVSGLARGIAERLDRPAPAAGIVMLPVGSPERALELAGLASSKGLDLRAVRPPSVPAGASGLRIACHAENTEAECDELTRLLAGNGTTPPRDSGPVDESRALFVVGTDTDIGKTVVSALLLRHARRLGRAAYWKPVQTGTDSDTEAVGRLSGAEPHELLRPAWSLALPASPHEAAAEAGVSVEARQLEEGLRGLLRTLDEHRIVVELAGGLLVPYRLEPEVETQGDWLARSRAPFVLVARSGLGTLNHTLLTLESLRTRHREPRALFLVGEPHASNRATLERAGGGVPVFELPLLEPLSTEALDAWLEANDLGGVFEP
jgi:8-amino-7-oxononanoate synthase